MGCGARCSRSSRPAAMMTGSGSPFGSLRCSSPSPRASMTCCSRGYPSTMSSSSASLFGSSFARCARALARSDLPPISPPYPPNAQAVALRFLLWFVLIRLINLVRPWTGSRRDLSRAASAGRVAGATTTCRAVGRGGRGAAAREPARAVRYPQGLVPQLDQSILEYPAAVTAAVTAAVPAGARGALLISGARQVPGVRCQPARDRGLAAAHEAVESVRPAFPPAPDRACERPAQP